jgi:hypothetical protein
MMLGVEMELESIRVLFESGACHDEVVMVFINISALRRCSRRSK